MQNFLFRKNSHSASVVAKALPRPPESPPSPALRPRLGLRLAHPTNRRRQPPSHGPPPQRPGYPKTAARECTKAGAPGRKRPAVPAERTPTSRYAPVQADETAGCGDMQKSVGRMGRQGLGKDSTVRRGMQIGHLPIVLQIGRPRTNVIGGVRKSAPSTAFVGRARPCSHSSAAPQRRRGRRLRIPPEAGGSDAVRQNRHSRTYVQTSYEDRTKKRPDQSGHPDRHAIAPDTTHTPDTRQTPHTRQTRTSRDEPRTTRLRHGNDIPHTTEQLPDKQPCRERPHRTATNTVGSFGRDKSHNPERPFSSSAPPVTMPSTLPDTTFAAPAGYNARNLAEYNARSPAGYDASAPPDTAFPHRSRTIPFTPLRPVRYKSGTAAARTAESRSKLW